MLNNKQLEAVNKIKGPVLIIAGPGTGKTKTLVERVVNILVKEKVEANRVVLTTFTNKAARELEQRINERLEEQNIFIDISEMYLGTMHSIWLRLIEENIEYSNFFDGFELMTSDYEQHFFIYSKLKEYKKLEGYKEFFENLSINSKELKSNGDWDISSYLRKKFNDLNENAIAIKEIRTSDKYINFLKAAYNLYEKQLFEANKLDFSYVQIEFYNMLLKNNDLLMKLNEKIDYLMIDEYQDSNRIQEKIILALSSLKKNICVVGDEDQSIYRFRGATTENILTFPKHFSEQCEVIVLDKNYRSVNDIVEFNNKWINSIDWKGNKFEKNIVSARTEEILNSNVLHISGKTSDENIRNTVNFIKKLKASNKISNFNQVAVLFSSFKDNNAKKLENLLNRENIEVFSPRTKVFFEMPEIKISLGLILACFKNYISISDEYLKSCLDSARYIVKIDKKLFEWIKEKIDNIDDYEYDSLNNLFYELFQFQYYKNILEEDSPKNSKARHNLSILTKVFKNYQLYISRSKISKKTNFNVITYFFDKYIFILKKSRIDDINDEEDYPDNCIPFLTIHNSKGLEFPIVIVYSLYDKPRIHEISGRITSIDMLLNTRTDISEIDKEYFDFYRKFYVAFTRAKNLLILSSNEEKISENFKPFFYSLPSVNSISFNIENLALDKLSEKKKKRNLSFTTDIVPYRLCSQKYKFMREERFQSFDKAIINRGIIAHKAIEHINKRLKQDKNRKFSEEYIEELITKIYRLKKLEIDESFYKIINLVLNYLEKEKDIFSYISKVEASEYRIEEDYLLYGQIDLILEKEDSLELIDFKTGYSDNLSLNKTYKEQLCLYKLLIQKKYPDKEIKTFLYYLEEEKKKEILISEDDLEENLLMIEELSSNIFNKNFKKREFDEKICGLCEYKYYCYGEKTL